MPQGEAAAPVTPADRRRRQRRGFIVFIAFILLVSGGLGTTVLMVNDARNLKRLMAAAGYEHIVAAPPPARVKVGRPQRLATLPPALTALLAPSPQPAGALLITARQSIQKRCLGLGTTPDNPPHFLQQGDDWECTWFQPIGNAADPASVFVQIKGTESNGLLSFRIKLNFTEAGRENDVIQAARATIQKFQLPLTANSQDYISERMRQNKPFKSQLDGHRVTFDREMMDSRRFNLLILPPAPYLPCPPAERAEAGEKTTAMLSSIACRPLPAGRLFAPRPR